MAWTSAIPLLGSLIDAGREWLNRRHEVKLKKHEADLKKIEVAGRVEVAEAEARIAALHRRAEADITWEEMSIQNSGWKDEGWTLLFWGMLIALFVPWSQPHVIEGFAALDDLPKYVQVFLSVAIGSAFGVRVFDNFVNIFRTK